MHPLNTTAPRFILYPPFYLNVIDLIEVFKGLIA
jgi:hypothetical protein